MKLYRFAIELGLIAGLAGSLAAAEVDGILIDKMCSMKSGNSGQKVAVTHTRECALMVQCEKSGYGVITADNKFIAFDGVGNTLATEALRASSQKDNLKVKIIGERTGDIIRCWIDTSHTTLRLRE